MEFPHPDWAIRESNGTLEEGSQLCTRDGRRMGNAHIIAVLPAPEWNKGKPIYRVLTDAGSEMLLIEAEILECFYPPIYVSDINKVLKKFSHKELEPA